MASRQLVWTNADARAALATYDHTVRALARRLCPLARAGQALELEDLHAEGQVAVLEALSSYEGFGIEAHVWVRTRVRQRMIDAIRRLDLRSREELRSISQATQRGADGSARARCARARQLVSFDAALPEAEPLSARLSDPDSKGPDELLELRTQRACLRRALSLLPPRQRAAIELGVFEGLPLREIGFRMGISESRVCQLQKRGVRQLRRAVLEAMPDAA